MRVRQLWELDDNTLTMSSLNQAQNKLDDWAKKYDVQLDTAAYHSDILKGF
ncbi:hypothetical protein JCM19231_3525 [Vibrio ishigakensis]|uniref:Uncharacterized protein n=1 Tax=Vibrio ishigakensis TaxID=1481914 RepID=A0A0B8NGY3_9VIBR|nr:hypothetical protein JCM19231_3525 [Vibrio ishigakensis]